MALHSTRTCLRCREDSRVVISFGQYNNGYIWENKTLYGARLSLLKGKSVSDSLEAIII